MALESGRVTEIVCSTFKTELLCVEGLEGEGGPVAGG